MFVLFLRSTTWLEGVSLFLLPRGQLLVRQSSRHGGSICNVLRSNPLQVGSSIQVFLVMEAVQGDIRNSTLQAPKITMFNGQASSMLGPLLLDTRDFNWSMMCRYRSGSPHRWVVRLDRIHVLNGIVTSETATASGSTLITE